MQTKIFVAENISTHMTASMQVLLNTGINISENFIKKNKIQQIRNQILFSISLMS